jgi:predicted ATPase
MVAAIAGEGVVPAPVLRELIDLADGNPFYVEELLASRAGGRGVAPGHGSIVSQPPAPSTGWQLPSGLQHVVHERLQHLSPAARDALRSAAVIGRRFDLALLQRVVRVVESVLLPLIRELVDWNLVVEESPHRFAFRHALIQQAAYRQLLGRERATLHHRVAEQAEVLYAAAVELHAADLSYHFAEAEVWDKAFLYARRAAEQARCVHAPRAVALHLSRALDAVEHLRRDSPGVDDVRASLHRERGQAYEQLGEFDAARSDYEAAVEVARLAADRREEWRSLSDLGLLWAQRDYARAGLYFRQALDLAAGSTTPACSRQASTAWATGR